MVEPTVPDDVLVRVGTAIALGGTGHRAEASALLSTLWQDIGGELGDPLHRCAIAHSMADAQDDPTEELRWDVRALEAAGLLTDERVIRAGMPGSAAGLFASLHLNLGDCYRRLGDRDSAREHLHRGIAALPALDEAGDGSMVREGLDRLGRRLVEASST